MFYGAMVWDPWLIVAQIVCLQCLYYLTLSLLMALLVGTRVSRMSLMYLFDFSTLSAATVTGWCAITSFLLASAAGALFMSYIVERAKKCLDFSATLYIIHLFICMIYGGWPSSMTWWIVNILGLALMSLLGEWLCIRREMREIPLTRLRPSTTREEGDEDTFVPSTQFTDDDVRDSRRSGKSVKHYNRRASKGGPQESTASLSRSTSVSSGRSSALETGWSMLRAGLKSFGRSSNNEDTTSTSPSESNVVSQSSQPVQPSDYEYSTGPPYQQSYPYLPPTYEDYSTYPTYASSSSDWNVQHTDVDNRSNDGQRFIDECLIMELEGTNFVSILNSYGVHIPDTFFG